MSENGEGNGENYWNQVNKARALHESFTPKNKYGMPIPVAERWGDMIYDIELAERERQNELARAERQRQEEARLQAMEAWLTASAFPAEIEAQIRQLHRLNQAAKAAQHVRNVANPTEGDFKTGEDGKLYRFTTQYWKKIEPSAANYNADKAAVAPATVAAPSVGDYKKVGAKVFRWTVEPTWLQVKRETDYNIDLGDTFARVDRLGRPYLNARNALWQIFYPDQQPIFRPARYRRRNTRRANRKNRKTTRRSKY